MTLDDCYEAKNQILNTKLEKNIYVPTYLFESEVKSHSEKKTHYEAPWWAKNLLFCSRHPLRIIITKKDNYNQEAVRSPSG